MRLQNLSTWMLSLALFMPLAACDEDDDGGDDSAGDSANGTEGNGDDGGNGDEGGNGMTSSSSETCVSNHTCINGVCTCQTPGLKDMPCSDDDACEEECEICD